MTDYYTAQTDPTSARRRRFSIKGPLTGLVLIGLVAYGSWWGWEKAFGDADPINIAVNTCPTPSATTATTAAPTTPAAVASSSSSSSSSSSWPAAGAVNAAYVAATTPTVPPTATPTAPAFLAPVNVEVNVYNATSRPGLAANTAAVLRDRGFTVDTVGNAEADDAVPEIAQIRAATADSPQVRLLVQHVPGAVIVPDGRADSTVDLVLGDQFASLGDPALVTPVPLPASTC